MEFDARLTALGIQVKENPGAKWKVVSCKYQDDKESGGNHHIYFTVLDASGKPAAGITCIVDWVGREPGDSPTRVPSKENEPANFPMFANLNTTLKNGPYFAFIEDQSKSDVVTGMGLPEKHHVNYLLTFQAATPDSGSTTLEQAAISAAKKLTWMPINTDGALYKFAQAQNLGYPQTDEFEFTFGSVVYVGQVYNLGIVFVKKGDWGNCKWVKKP